MELLEIIKKAEEEKKAIGHFNFSNLEGFWAIFNAAKELNVPIIFGTSEGERDFVGLRQAVLLVKSLRDEFNYPAYINADHTYSIEGVKKAAEAGYDAIIFDGAKLSYEENIKLTKEAVEIAKNIKHDLIIEAELGYIGASSKLLDKIPEGTGLAETYTKPEQAKEFIKETGIDLLAPSVGNLHGMLKNMPQPRLDIERINEIRNTCDAPLVLHGGSGISDEDFKKSIESGISVVHINTEIRKAFREKLDIVLNEKTEEIAPYKIMKEPRLAMEAVVKERLRLFNGI